MPHVLTSIDQATPAWLTGVLCRDGYLLSGEVQSIKVRRIFTEQLASISYFLAVAYSDDATPAAPTRLFLKLPRSNLGPGVAAAIGEKEVCMYQALAEHQRELPIIQCYDAVYDSARGAYHILLDDLSDTHDQPAWHLEIAERYITQTVDCLAQFHAYWWEHPRLGAIAGVLPALATMQAEIQRLQGAFAGFADVAGDRLSAEDRGIYEAILTALPALWRQRTNPRGQTLVHGDAHFWNFLYPLDSQRHHTCILDWQLSHICPSTQDLAYAIVLRYPHRTPAIERGLLTRYYDRLLLYGVPNYSWEACWNDYRRQAAEQVLFPLRCWMSGLPTDFWNVFLQRPLTAFRDLGCAEVLA
ncbi:MAG: aminoglycoside phosphotransferase family protein [Roseiflexaceae bacterium]